MIAIATGRLYESLLTHFVTACVSSFPVFDTPLQYALFMVLSALLRAPAGRRLYNTPISWKQHSLETR